MPLLAGNVENTGALKLKRMCSVREKDESSDEMTRQNTFR